MKIIKRKNSFDIKFLLFHLVGVYVLWKMEITSIECAIVDVFGEKRV